MLPSEWPALAERLVHQIEQVEFTLRRLRLDESKACQIRHTAVIAFIETEFGRASGLPSAAMAKGLFCLLDELECDLCAPADRNLRLEATMTYLPEYVSGDF